MFSTRTRMRTEAKAAANMELSPVLLLDPKTVATMGDTGIDLQIKIHETRVVAPVQYNLTIARSQVLYNVQRTQLISISISLAASHRSLTTVAAVGVGYSSQVNIGAIRSFTGRLSIGFISCNVTYSTCRAERTRCQSVNYGCGSSQMDAVSWQLN